MLETTLNRIRSQRPCQAGWAKLLHGLGKKKADSAPLPYWRIVDVVGIEDAIWCCGAEPKYEKAWRAFAAWGAVQVRPWMADRRSRHATRIIARHARGDANLADLARARNIASAAYADAEKDGNRIGRSRQSVALVRADFAAARAACEAAHPDAFEAAYNVTQSLMEGAWDAAGRSVSPEEAIDIALHAMQAQFLRIVGAPEKAKKS
jgi:hypothetical protein